MTYELAKKLKEAGFPQRGLDGNLYKVKEEYKDSDEFLNLYPTTPTLSELIEACDATKNGFILEFENGKWRADATWKNSDYKGIGLTPEEAVSQLWLALNKTEK